jgi:hypothetical protein
VTPSVNGGEVRLVVLAADVDDGAAVGAADVADVGVGESVGS